MTFFRSVIVYSSVLVGLYVCFSGRGYAVGDRQKFTELLGLIHQHRIASLPKQVQPDGLIARPERAIYTFAYPILNQLTYEARFLKAHVDKLSCSNNISRNQKPSLSWSNALVKMPLLHKYNHEWPQWFDRHQSIANPFADPLNAVSTHAELLQRKVDTAHSLADLSMRDLYAFSDQYLVTVLLRLAMIELETDAEKSAETISSIFDTPSHFLLSQYWENKFFDHHLRAPLIDDYQHPSARNLTLEIQPGDIIVQPIYLPPVEPKMLSSRDLMENYQGQLRAAPEDTLGVMSMPSQ